MKLPFKIVAILSILTFLNLKGQIVIDNNVTAQAMAENIMFPANSIVAGSVVLNCPVGAFGTFTNGLSDGLSIDNGIILTTGQTSIFNQNNLGGSSGVNNGITAFIDADLQAVEPFATFDGCKIEFDIKPVCNKLVLDYIFGSDEYPEFVNGGYNDAFGFFVSGPGIVGTANIGTIPGSSTLVSIDNVNQNLNSSYYVNNQFTYNIEYDGYTKGLFAEIDVTPCEIYHIKIAIADAGDGIYDSGVLISVNSPPCPVNLVAWEAVTSEGTEGCINLNVNLTRSGETASPLTVDIATIGTATNGSDYTFGTTSHTFPANATTTSFTIPILADAIVELEETLSLIASISNCGNFYRDTIDLTINESSLDLDSVIQNESCIAFCDGAITINPIAPGTYSYLWNTGATSNQISNLCAGNYNVQISNGTGCNVSKNITILPGGSWPDANVANIGPICDSWEMQNFNPTTPGGTFTGTGVIGNPQVFSPAIAGAGIHTISYTVGLTCKSTSTFTVEVLPKQTVDINNVNPVCENEIAVNLSVNRGNGIWTGNGVSDAVNGIFNPSLVGSGNHTIYYEIAGLCGDTASEIIQVASPIDPSIIVPNLICDGDENAVLLPVNPGGTWQSPIVDSNGKILPNTSEGTYTIYYQIVDLCTSIDSATITILRTPIANFTNSPSTCTPMTLLLTDVSDSNAVSTIWTINNGVAQSSLDSIKIVLNEVDCYDVKMVNTFSNGCIDTISKIDLVCSSPKPLIDFQYSPTEINLSDQVISFNNLTTGETEIRWDFGILGTKSESKEENEIVRFLLTKPDTIDIELWAINNLGCMDSLSKQIIIKNITTFYVPNAFTPDGDGINDVFYPETNEYEIQDFSFWIFNRWGELIFESTNLHKGWDGTVIGGKKDNIAQNDVYVWKINYTFGERKTIKELAGTVTLVR